MLTACSMLMFLAAFLNVGPNLAIAREVQESSGKSEFIKLEKIWNEAHVNGDADALDRLWAEDLTVTVPNMAVISKQTAMSLTRSGRIKFKRYETSEIKIRVYINSAIVTGVVERIRNLNGSDVEDKWRFTKVYIQRAGKWQVVAWHASTIDQ